MHLRALFGAVLLHAVGSAVDSSEAPITLPRAPGDSDYWVRRKAVVLRLEWTDPDSVPEARLLRSEAPRRVVDSLLTFAKRLRWPEDLSPSVRRGWTEDALFATDRTESAAWPAAPHLPEAVEWALGSGPAAAWLQAHAKVDPHFALDDFVRSGSRAIRRYTPTNHPDLLHAAPAQAKAEFGVLARSADERWVLDPLYGTEIYADGEVGRDVDMGFQIYDARSGDLVFHDVGPQVDLGFWLDARTFVLLGHEEVNPIRDSFGFVPVVWVGDVESGRITSYWGAPLPPLMRRAFWREALLAVYRAAYPRLRFED